MVPMPRMALFNVIDGSLRVEYDVLAQSLGYQRVLSEREKEQIRSGYLWMDWFCVPQRRSSLHASIVQLKECMPSYVERCALGMHETFDLNVLNTGEQWIEHITLLGDGRTLASIC